MPLLASSRRAPAPPVSARRTLTPPAAAGRRDRLALAAWALLIVACWAWGTQLNRSGVDLLLGAPPLLGSFDAQANAPGLIGAVAFAVFVVAAGPAFARRVSWPVLLAGTMLGLAAWAVVVALIGGVGGITDPVRLRGEYLGTVPLVGSPGDFLSHFLAGIDGFPTHVRSHPPGMVLVLWSLSKLGLGGAGPAAALTIAVGASSAPAALLATRAVAGEAKARTAAPFLVLVPGAIWIATAADAFYAGVLAWAIALLILAMSCEGQRSDRLALAGGLLFGAAAFLSYGILLLATIPLAVAISWRRARPLLIAGAAVLTVVALFALAGFWWLDGYLETRRQYAASSAQNRPYYFFVFNNLAAFAIALGPALAIALGRLRDARVWLLVGGALAALALADLSGMSKAEVERIWLPFLPWILLAAVALPAGRARRLLAAQAALTIVVEVGVQTPW